MNNIDLVVPYVDSSDPEWQRLFNEYNDKSFVSEGVNAANRFRGQGEFFRYFFRCIEANLPWIHKVFLLCQSETQVPKWINRSIVNVVLHKDFIPEQFLPTFNSCTIEMFLWNIPGLSEHFLYANDDIYIMRYLKPEHFFKGNMTEITFRQFKLDSMYGHHCQNSYRLIYPNEPSFPYLGLGHQFRPFRLSYMKKCFEEHRDVFLNSISTFRSDKNFNCYVFALYQREKGITEPLTYSHACVGQIPSVDLLNRLLNKDMLCINDGDPNVDIYKNSNLLQAFKHAFPFPSKYEKEYNPYHSNQSRKQQNKEVVDNIHQQKPSSSVDMMDWLFK